MELEYFGAFKIARRKYNDLITPLCNKYNLTKNELDIITFLESHEHSDSAKDIAISQGKTKSHLSLSINSLYDKGLISEVRDENDTRKIHLSLTESALPIAKEIKELKQKFFKQLFNGVSKKEMKDFITVLNTARENIKNNMEL